MKTSCQPRITIVTPSFNQAAFLEQTIDSVLSQGYPDLEYIIMDGGSTDGSIDIIRRHEKHLAYWVSEKDHGPADALSKGFSRATGTILAYLNSDDIYTPGSLEAIAEVMNDPAVDVAYGNMYWVDARWKHHRRATPDAIHAAWAYLYGGATLQQPATFWKRELYRHCGEIDASYQFAYDTDLFVRFALRGARFKHVNRFVASFRIHPQSKSSNEFDLCSQRIATPAGSLPAFPIPLFSRTLRARNGDGPAQLTGMPHKATCCGCCSRIPDRIRARNAQEIVGPHGRRM